MKVINYFTSFLVTALLFTGCSKNNDEEAPAPSKYITVNTGILSRVSDDGSKFTAGDNLMLYGWTGDKSNPGGSIMVVNGVKNTTSDGNLWLPEIPMLWKDTTTPHYFAAVSPAMTISDLTGIDIVLKGELAEDDIMAANNLNGVKASDGDGKGKVAMIFDHLMSRIIVNLTYKNEFGLDSEGKPIIPEVNEATIKLVREAKLNVLGKSATLGAGNAGAMNLVVVKAKEEYRMIAVPQTIKKGESFITLKIKNKDYIYTPAEDIVLQAGMSTHIKLTVGREAIYLEGITVNGWGEGGEHGGEAI